METDTIIQKSVVLLLVQRIPNPNYSAWILTFLDGNPMSYFSDIRPFGGDFNNSHLRFDDISSNNVTLSHLEDFVIDLPTEHEARQLLFG